MKTPKLIAFAFIIGVIISCDDNPLKVCASCTEKNSGTKAADYCANAVSVETYITTLKNTSGQDWTCTKH